MYCHRKTNKLLMQGGRKIIIAMIYNTQFPLETAHWLLFNTIILTISIIIISSSQTFLGLQLNDCPQHRANYSVLATLFISELVLLKGAGFEWYKLKQNNKKHFQGGKSLAKRTDTKVFYNSPWHKSGIVFVEIIVTVQ